MKNLLFKADERNRDECSTAEVEPCVRFFARYHCLTVADYRPPRDFLRGSQETYGGTPHLPIDGSRDACTPTAKPEADGRNEPMASDCGEALVRILPYVCVGGMLGHEWHLPCVEGGAWDVPVRSLDSTYQQREGWITCSIGRG